MALDDPSVLVSPHKREPFDGELASRLEVPEALKTLAGLIAIGKLNCDDRLAGAGIGIREGRVGLLSEGLEVIFGLLKMRLSSCGVLSEGRLGFLSRGREAILGLLKMRLMLGCGFLVLHGRISQAVWRSHWLFPFVSGQSCTSPPRLMTRRHAFCVI
ncbi:MAG TPA: hypothetical protein VMU39_10375 [Solirubrobacteraceae bacterium]|nr:hypothetical protein [Solirubrobacteraceae bacterium]